MEIPCHPVPLLLHCLLLVPYVLRPFISLDLLPPLSLALLPFPVPLFDWSSLQLGPCQRSSCPPAACLLSLACLLLFMRCAGFLPFGGCAWMMSVGLSCHLSRTEPSTVCKIASFTFRHLNEESLGALRVLVEISVPGRSSLILAHGAINIPAGARRSKW